MFKVPVDNLTDYFNFDADRKRDLQKLDKLIRDCAPALARYFHTGTPAGQPGMRFKMIGYGRFQYPAANGQHVEWPVIGVALQKNYISIYISASRNRTPLVRCYADTLHCLRSGANNFSFETYDDLDADVLGSLLSEAAKIFASDPQNAIRYKTGAENEVS